MKYITLNHFSGLFNNIKRLYHLLLTSCKKLQSKTIAECTVGYGDQTYYIISNTEYKIFVYNITFLFIICNDILFFYKYD